MAKSTTKEEIPVPVEEETTVPEVPEVPEVPTDDGYETVYIERRGDEAPTKFFGIDGKTYNVPTGQFVKVPHEVADEIRRSEAAKRRASERARKIREAEEAANREQAAKIT